MNCSPSREPSRAARKPGAHGGTPIGYPATVRLRLAQALLPVPIDLNVVRLETLLGAVRDARGQIRRMVGAPPGWFSADEHVRWGFALGEADVALRHAVEGAAEETVGAPCLRTYANTHGAVARVARWCAKQSEPRGRADIPTALAFETVAHELAPILRYADRAPHWLRERARRARSTRSGKR